MKGLAVEPILSTILLLVLVAGAWLTASRLGWLGPEKKAIANGETYQRPLQDQLKNPQNALEQGKRDMLIPIIDYLYQNDPNLMLNMIISVEGAGTLRKISELICEDGHEWRLKKYNTISLKDGRLSRTYLASPNSDDFAQYILGGQQMMDKLDKYIAMIHDEKKLRDARLEGLAEADERFKLTRTELKKLQDPKIRAEDDLSRFDKQMKEIEGNG